VIDPRAGVGDLFVRRIDPLGQHHGRTLDRVAQTGDWNKGLALDGSTQHSHRVRVVEQHGVGAVTIHITHDLHHIRQGAQKAENARGAARVTDVDINAIFLGDFDIVTPNFGTP